MTKNILYAIDTGGPGGAETMVVRIMRNLDRTKYAPIVVLKRKGWLYDEIVKLGIYPEVVEMNGSFNVRYLASLIRTIKKNKIDLVHSHLFGSNVYSCIAGLLCHVPVISTFHGMVDSDLNGRMVRPKCQIINFGSRFIIFVSNSLKEYYMANTPLNRGKSLTIYNGVDSPKRSLELKAQARKEQGYSDNDFLIGSVGNIRPAKGYDVLLKAAAMVTRRFPQSKFVIAGEGNGPLYDHLLLMKQELGLSQSVRFLGFVEDTSRVLNCLDLFVLPSTTEGFSLSTVEAMAAGLPVIVTNSGGPIEIVTHLHDGIVVDPNSPECLAERIQQCIQDETLRKTLSSNARQTTQSKFGVKAMMEQYEKIYDCIIT